MKRARVTVHALTRWHRPKLVRWLESAGMEGIELVPKASVRFTTEPELGAQVLSTLRHLFPWSYSSGFSERIEV